MPQQRLYYIDNLRIFLISLVVLHHFAITYGAPGGWYYNETEAGMPEIIPMSMFVATNQAFFMGMFFFISAFFLVPSLESKGLGRFVSGRLIRLGIPTLLFFFLLNPLTNFIANHYIRKQEPGLWQHIVSGRAFGFGPMWFVEALMLFTAIYLLVRMIPSKIRIPFPGTKKILLAAVLVGITQFIIRLKLPVGWSWSFTNFQFPFFVQYIVLFAVGIIARQNNWLDHLHPKAGKQWFVFAQALIFIGFPAIFIGGKAMSLGLDPFMGGLTYQSLSYAIWEQLVGFSLIVGLLGIFKSRLNAQGNFARQLSESAYGVFVFHAPLIVAISAVFLNFSIPSYLKFLVLAPLALLVTFLFARLIKLLPVLKRIF
jgi:glucans biosynthesis protein C